MKRVELAARVLAALEDRPTGAGSFELGVALGAPRRSVHEALQTLVETGQVIGRTEYRRHGRYFHRWYAAEAAAYRPGQKVEPEPKAAPVPAYQGELPLRRAALDELSPVRTEWRVIDGRRVPVHIGPTLRERALPVPPVFSALVPGHYVLGDETAVARWLGAPR